jgi:hypothetical protein
VKAISHLQSLRRAHASALRIETAAVPADDLNTGMLTQPLGGRLSRAVRQDVDDLPPFEVDYDRPVTKAFLPSPVIDPDYPHSRCVNLRDEIALETA